MVVKGYNVGPLAKKVAKEVMDDNVLGLAAGTAYYFFFSLFPIFLFLAPLLSLVGNERETFSSIMEYLSQVVPAEAYALMQNVVASVVFSEEAPGLVSVGAFLALWAGSNIFNALMEALNGAYDVKETRAWWKRKLMAMAAVVVSGLIVITATIVLLAGDKIVDWIGDRIGLGEIARVLWTAVPIPLALVALVALAWGVLTFLPNVRQNLRHTLVGAVVTTVLWLLVTLAFRFYVQNFGNYNATYGTIGAVIVLLTWMYLSMVTVLIGGEVASELHHGTGAVNPRRGATIGDRIASGGGRASTERIARVEPMAARGARSDER
jgi:membrane protein